MTPPAISFIVPTFNAAATLGDAIASLKSQTRSDWEAVIVDDASTDQTATLAEKLAHDDSRIRCVRIEKGGASAARNRGLSIAVAPWVTFLDSDDWLSPDYCSLMLGAARDRIDVVYCGHQRTTPDRVASIKSFNPGLEHDAFSVLARENALAIHAVMVRRDLFTAIGGGFDTGLVSAEDWDLWQRIARSGAKFIGVRQTLAFYRMQRSSLSAKREQTVRDCLTVLARGYRADPRLPRSKSAFPDGLSLKDERIRATLITAWYGAADISAGGDGLALLALGPRGAAGPSVKLNLARAIAEGLVVGGCATPLTICGAWESLLPRVLKLSTTILPDLEGGPSRQGMLYLLERSLLELLPAGSSANLTQTARIAIDVGKIRGGDLPRNVDCAFVELMAHGEPVAWIEIPVSGSLTPRDIVEIAVRSLGPRFVARATGQLHRPSFVIKAARRFTKEVTRQAPVGHSLRKRLRHAAKIALHNSVVEKFGPPSPPLWRRANLPPPKPVGAVANPGETHRTAPRPETAQNRPSLWNAVFAEPDPWNYGSDYERKKYDLTLEVIPPGKNGRALELACAEGLFTARLAQRVEQLIAADISSTALDRARRRCANHHNIDFRQLDLIADDLPADQDLILCSEVLYYLEGQHQLPFIARKLRDALAPGGRLVMANYFVLKDDMSATGFDWDQGYGAKIIHEAFLREPGLSLERSITTEIYRVDCFKRIEANEVRDEPDIKQQSIADTVGPELARQIVWGGATARRDVLARTEKTWLVPVLMYHRIASDGPSRLNTWRTTPDSFRSQLRLLRARGYHSVTSVDLRRHRAEERPLAGRPVVITFDDGYEDFATTAWPILYAEGFSAEVFVVTDLVGRTAEWDATPGEPGASLMSWEAIISLHRKGVSFGSHLATHTRATEMRNRDVLAEALRSRDALQTNLQADVVSVAAPHGAIDERVSRLFDDAGYLVAFSTRPSIADIRGNLLSLPRINVDGDWSMDAFAKAIEIK